MKAHSNIYSEYHIGIILLLALTDFKTVGQRKKK